MASIMRKCVIRAVCSALVISCSIAVTMKIFSIFLLAALCTTSWAVLPNYLPATRGNALSRDEVIESYFHLGFTAQEIVLFVTNVHCMYISLRHLKRILRRLGCRRRRFQSNLDEVVDVVQEELKGSGSLLGYRAMHQRLLNHHGLVTTREVVRHILRVFDPEGVEHRSRHRLRRRVYRSKGPNFLGHIDGYDKLKPFGFCVHGAINGFSRQILWLEVASSNNDPKIVAQYYLDYVRQSSATERIIRGDRGTENVNVAAIQ